MLRNKILDTISGDVDERSLLTTIPAVLKRRSLGTLVAGIARYLNATADRSGYCVWAERQNATG